jgi:hypothetical protein
VCPALQLAHQQATLRDQRAKAWDRTRGLSLFRRALVPTELPRQVSPVGLGPALGTGAGYCFSESARRLRFGTRADASRGPGQIRTDKPPECKTGALPLELQAHTPVSRWSFRVCVYPITNGHSATGSALWNCRDSNPGANRLRHAAFPSGRNQPVPWVGSAPDSRIPQGLPLDYVRTRYRLSHYALVAYVGCLCSELGTNGCWAERPTHYTQ